MMAKEKNRVETKGFCFKFTKWTFICYNLLLMVRANIII